MARANKQRGGYAARGAARLDVPSQWVFWARGGAASGEFFGGIGWGGAVLAFGSDLAGRAGGVANVPGSPSTISGTYAMRGGKVGMALSERTSQALENAPETGAMRQIVQLRARADRDGLQLGARRGRSRRAGGVPPSRARVSIHARRVREDRDLENLWAGAARGAAVAAFNHVGMTRLEGVAKLQRLQMGSGVQGSRVRDRSAAESADFRGLKRGRGKGRAHRSICCAGERATLRPNRAAVNGGAA